MSEIIQRLTYDDGTFESELVQLSFKGAVEIARIILDKVGDVE